MQHAARQSLLDANPEWPMEMAKAAVWQPAVAECPLCGGRRRDYLFVVGQSRMTRCHECGLISRTDAGPDPASNDAKSYALDEATDRSVRDQLAAAGSRVMEVLIGSPAPRLGADARFQCDLVDPFADAGRFESAPPRGYDAAFLNGVLEETADPVGLLRRVRASLRGGGTMVALVSSGDLARLPADGSKFPRHVFTPATLLRLAAAAGFRAQSCGLLERPPGSVSRDARLDVPVRFAGLKRLLGWLGRPPQVPSGLLQLVTVVADGPARPRLSIIMPVYNEAPTFRDTYARVQGATVEGLEREIVVVESNSTDGSRELVRAIEKDPGVRVIYEDRPRGKGHAVRAGLEAASGNLILIQDADSEYDISDYDIVLEPLLRLSATFVLGSRHLGGRTWKIRKFADYKVLATVMNLAHEFFTALANWLYGADMRDPTTMYKVFRRECVEGLAFRRDRFDFDWELVCKLIRSGHMPLEVPINYRARSYSEGKKVRFFRDPLTWLSAIVSSRFERLR